ncbi:MAG: AmmeMemoRadiSam system protein B [Gemmatimonadaceae bacterium]|nr:AmmeMemoRadiSam system protein B [Gemmatimonadaceae bacterium]
MTAPAAVVPTRHPAVSGTFYPSLPGRLRADLREYLARAGRPRRAVGILAPHPALLYGGPVAGAVFGSVVVPDTVVVLAPNHTGRSISLEGGSILLSRAYRTPLGDVAPDQELGEALLERAAPLLVEDMVAHTEEHGIEVLLPFVQMRNRDVRIVPIVVGWRDWARSRSLAAALHEAIGDREVLVVASSDLSHYETAAHAEAKDAVLLEAVMALDGEALVRAVAIENIAMCGVAPTATACEYARLRGATGAELVSYSHSGVVTGDVERVVGYAGVLLGAE